NRRAANAVVCPGPVVRGVDIDCVACREKSDGGPGGPAAGAGSDEHRRRSRRDNREARSKRNRGWIGRNLRQDYERIRDRAGSSERIAGLGGPGRSSADTGWLELRRPIWDDPCLGTFLFLSERWTPARPWPAVARAT